MYMVAVIFPYNTIKQKIFIQIEFPYFTQLKTHQKQVFNKIIIILAVGLRHYQTSYQMLIEIS